MQDKFFKLIDESSNLWECICGKKRQQSGTSYVNLVSYVQYAHASSYEELVRDISAGNTVSQTSSSNLNQALLLIKNKEYLWMA